MSHHDKNQTFFSFSNLLNSTKSKDDSPFIFLDNSDAEEDGDREGQNNQDDREGEDD